jgi:hypothetical protein
MILDTKCLRLGFMAVLRLIRGGVGILRVKMNTYEAMNIEESLGLYITKIVLAKYMCYLIY